MFYAFVTDLPLVKKELNELLLGHILDFSIGYLRQVTEKDMTMSFILRDKVRGVIYRAARAELVVTRGGDGNRPYQQVRIGMPKRRTGRLVLADFKDLDERGDVRSFIEALSEMQQEYDKRNSALERFKRWIGDPIARLFLLAVVAYSIVTAYVMFAG